MTTDDVEIVRLRAALQAIVDYEPELEYPEINTDDCEQCAYWRAKNHPIQRMCDDHYREHYKADDRRNYVRSVQHYRLRDIAREALNVDV